MASKKQSFVHTIFNALDGGYDLLSDAEHYDALVEILYEIQDRMDELYAITTSKAGEE